MTISNASARRFTKEPCLRPAFLTRQSYKTQQRWIASRPSTIRTAQRAFTTSPPLLKKGGKAAREEKQQSTGSKSTTATDDPYDFADLEFDIAQAVERLKTELSKLRAGGRFNPEVVESLRVQVDKGSNQTFRLSDLAQVIPKGRTVHILVGEKDVC